MNIKNFKSFVKRFFKLEYPENVIIGKYSYGKPLIYMWTGKYKVIIGKYCSISINTIIIVDGNHRTDWITTYPFNETFKDLKKISGHPVGKGDVIIGNDVWIGMNVLILPGVRIGDGAVIGAGSVVTRNVEDYEIVAGNPAKHIKYRFKENQIVELKKIKWWDWHKERIVDNIELLQSSRLDEFIEKFRKS